QQLRTGFSFSRRSLSANVGRRVSSAVSVTGNYLLQRTSVFNLQVSPSDLLFIDRTFPQFRLSSFSGSLIYDTRNDAVDPVAGNYANANLQVAGQNIGSEVGFVKSFFTAEVFRQLPRAPRLVFAANARFGLANGFANQGELPASERFFAGGDTTNRGFALDTLGVRHVPAQPGDTLDQAGFPIGGNGVVVLMGEVRARLAGSFGVVGFVDTGNVFAHATDIDVTELRSAVGGGIRYKSPFGPIRLDLGFKVHPQPGESPTAWFVSFGQAF
ncbi:MAG TPA: BamA/TamA family outer membrane protein, partial [Rhodanobacteraceae bacterium]